MTRKISKTTRSNFITYGMVTVLFIVMFILQCTGSLTSSMSGFLVPLCIYIIMAISLNLVVGILGELSLGHGGFMCIGAYTSAVFSIAAQNLITFAPLRFAIAIAIGAACAAVFGLLIGIPVLRLKGDYLAIVTLAFGEIIKNLVNVINLGYDSNGVQFSINAPLNLGSDGIFIVKGAQGVSGTPQDSSFIAGFVLVIIALAVVLNLINSRDGRAIMAIRDNRIAAESVGIDITKYKLMVFTISAALAGTAGALYSHNFATLTSSGDKFNYNASIMILVYVVLGGIGNIRGSVIATIILYLLPEKLRFLSDYRMLVYAIVLIVVMIVNWNPTAKAYTEMLALKIKNFFKSLFKKNKKEEIKR